jgi:hypothetical protein
MNSIAIFGPIAFAISVILIATPFMAYYAQSAHFYTIHPSNCDSSYFTNDSSWFTSEWVVIPAYGVCPIGAYTYHYVSGYAYHDCIEWTDKPQWVELDEDNASTGYKTYMKNGAAVWKVAESCLIFATIFLFFIPFTVIAVGSQEVRNEVYISSLSDTTDGLAITK